MIEREDPQRITEVVLEGVLDTRSGDSCCHISWLTLDGENLAYHGLLWDFEGRRVRITIEVVPD